MQPCEKCGRTYQEWMDKCPYCGSRERKRKSPLIPYIAAIAIIILVLAGIVLVEGPITAFANATVNSSRTPEKTLAPVPMAPQQIMTPPSCSVNAVFISVMRVGTRISLTVTGGDLLTAKTMTVMLNGAPAGTLQNTSGSRLDVQGTSGPDSLVVVATSTCGVESVVLSRQI
jgi:hypothetical protein